MDVERRPAARAKLVDFILVAAAGALVLVVIGVSIAAQLVTRLATEASSKIGLGRRPDRRGSTHRCPARPVVPR